MQLGARWRVGDAPHRGVPEALHPAIAEQELLHPQAQAWTLTWLEGRPRCALDGLVLLTLDASGAPTLLGGPSGSDAHEHPHSADEDDDWLN